MAKEIKDWKKNRKDRIKEIDMQILKLKGANDQIIAGAQLEQQKLAKNNTEIIRLQGGKEELERQVKG